MKRLIWMTLRIVMGFLFLWPFFDKLLGLGYATPKEGAWISGGSPTTGYLTHSTYGPFAEFFQSLAGLGFGGINIIDWIFMTGLLAVGISLIFNKFIKLGALAGSLMLILMWLAALPPEHNPIIDDHVVYTLVLIAIAYKSRERRYH